MEEAGYSLRNHRHVPSFASFVYVLSESGTLQGVAVLLEDMHVIANPLLDKDCKECRRKTEDKGHEPEDIYTYVGRRWVESRERGWRSGRERKLWGDEGDLLGDLRKESDIVLKVIDHLICWVDFQVLFTVDYEWGEGSGK